MKHKTSISFFLTKYAFWEFKISQKQQVWTWISHKSNQTEKRNLSICLLVQIDIPKYFQKIEIIQNKRLGKTRMLFKNSKYPNNNKVKREFLTSLTKLEREICLLVQIESPKCWKYPKENHHEEQLMDTIFKKSSNFI